MTADSAAFELQVRPSTKKDALPLFRSLRPEDLRELSVGHPTEEQCLHSIRSGIQRSDPCYTVHVAGRPVAVFGAVPGTVRGEPVGICWLLGSSDLVNPLGNRTRFIRESEKWLDRLHENYPTLWNLIDSRNSVHLRWVRWLGFDISNSIELGHDRIVFHEIISRKS